MKYCIWNLEIDWTQLPVVRFKFTYLTGNNKIALQCFMLKLIFSVTIETAGCWI